MAVHDNSLMFMKLTMITDVDTLVTLGTAFAQQMQLSNKLEAEACKYLHEGILKTLNMNCN